MTTGMLCSSPPMQLMSTRQAALQVLQRQQPCRNERKKGENKDSALTDALKRSSTTAYAKFKMIEKVKERAYAYRAVRCLVALEHGLVI
eukprot:1192828-Pleurochrysis_carterae.AAC.4